MYGQLRARTWELGSPHGSRLGYLGWLMSCGLFQLNPGAWGDAPTITTTKRSYHHLAILNYQHHNNECNVDNNNYNNNVKKNSFCYTYTRKIYFFSWLQQKWHSAPPTLQDFILQAIHLSPTILVFSGLLGVVS